MIDNIPYITVDNRKIAPLYRVSKPYSASDGTPGRDDRPFGVVDRITISGEAMEKYRQLQAQVEADPPALTVSSGKTRTSTVPLLTDSPKMRR
jgi:hypothetical protein